MDNNLNLDLKSLEELERMFSEILTPDIKNGIKSSEESIQKTIDDLVNQYKSFKIEINFLNKSNNPDPTYSHKGDSGFDLRAFIDTEEKVMTLLPGQWKAIPTGLYFEIPNNYELQVRPRSGLAFKHGVTVLNSPGTVDSGYRGEIQVILINHSKEPFVIKNGDRIAQGVISTVSSESFINLNKVLQLSESERGEGKFGSTGVK